MGAKTRKDQYKSRTSGHPISSHPFHHLTDVQRGVASARASDCAPQSQRRRKGTLRGQDQCLQILKAVMGGKGKGQLRDPLG